jgi:hypothetical protein
MAGSDPLNKTYVYTALQGLANRTRFLKDNKVDLTSGNYLWKGGLPPSLRWISNTQIEVGACAGLIVNGVSHDSGLGATTLTPTIASSTWYYVYAYDSSGTLTYEVTINAPDATLTHESTDATRRYIGCFRTDDTAHVLPFRMHNRRYIYRWSARTDNTFWQSLTAGASTGGTAIFLLDGVSATSLLPPHARIAIVQLQTSNGSGGIATASLTTNGDSGTGFQTVSDAGQYTSDVFEIETDSNRELHYITSSASNHVNVFVMGYVE